MQELYIKTYTWRSGKPESPQDLNKSLAPTHAPFPGSDTGLALATKRMMSFALTSTIKQGDEDCEPNNPKKPCVVEVKGDSGPEIPDFRDASIGDVSSIVRRAISNAKFYLKNTPGCANFLQKVIENLNVVNVRGLLTLSSDHTDANGGITARYVKPSELLDLLDSAKIIETGKSGVQVEGSVEYINALGARPGEILVNAAFSNQKREDQTFAIIHESFHQLEGGSDEEIARAAQLAAGVKPKDLKVFKGSEEERRKAASMTFNEIVFAPTRCVGLSVPTGTTIRVN